MAENYAQYVNKRKMYNLNQFILKQNVFGIEKLQAHCFCSEFLELNTAHHIFPLSIKKTGGSPINSVNSKHQ